MIGNEKLRKIYNGSLSLCNHGKMTAVVYLAEKRKIASTGAIIPWVSIRISRRNTREQPQNSSCKSTVSMSAN